MNYLEELAYLWAALDGVIYNPPQLLGEFTG